MRKLTKLSLFFGLFLIALSFTAGVYAVNDNSNSNSEFKQFKVPEAKDRKNLAQAEKKASAAATRTAKLSEARLKFCRAKERVIENRFKALLALGVKTHTGKERIVTRVDEFYTNVLVPKGYTLPNYDVLKADIAAKEANVQTTLDEAKSNGQEFSCDSDDPKAVTDLFRQNIQDLIAANRQYRASVRAFVVAVRDLAKQAKADTLSQSPEVSPLATPVVSPVVSEAPEL